MTRATAFQAKLRRHVACDCGDVAIVILDMLDRCCVIATRGSGFDDDADAGLGGDHVQTQGGAEKCLSRNPTEKLLNICGPFRGEGSLVALLVKLNTNIDGGFGPSWKRDAEATARLLNEAAASLDSTAREMLRRHMALHDDVPVNRGGRAWPIFSKLVAARSTPRAEAKAASPRSSCGSMDSRDSYNGSPSMRAPQNTPAKATSPTNTFDDDGAGRPGGLLFVQG